MHWTEFTKHDHDVYHPIKLTGALLTRTLMRDDGWMRVGTSE